MVNIPPAINSAIAAKFNRIKELAVILCNSQASYITLAAGEKEKIKSSYGWAADELPANLTHSVLQFRSAAVFEIRDTRNAVPFNSDPCFIQDMEIRFFAGFICAGQEGSVLGGLYITENKPRQLTSLQKKGLELLGTELTELLLALKQDDRNIQHSIHTEPETITSKKILSSFVKHVPAAVAMLDKDMHFIAASNRWLEEYELQDTQVLGSSYYTVFPHLDEERRARHQRILAGATERVEEDLFYGKSREEPSNISWEMRPWYGEDDKIGGMMIFTQNITQIITQKNELLEARRTAEKASLAKSDFLASMSHEIRTPLNGVIGFTDLVMKTHLSNTQQQYLSIVHQSANSLLDIINDILDFSKIEAGKLDLDIEECDLYELSSQATDMIIYQVQKKDLELLLNIQPGSPALIWADCVRLKQILVNLLGNAVKFTDSGEIELRVEVISGAGDDTQMRFSVRDTGIGIKAERQEKIFEAFSQEDGSTTKKYGGTGLGLTITNKLLGLMGSKLQLHSTPGEGSNFFFMVNLKTSLADPQQQQNFDLIKKVLIVDDNSNSRQILENMLQLKHISSGAVQSGAEALNILASREQFDVILMDYHMPHMNGLDTIRKIRSSTDGRYNHIPIILLFSSSDDEKVITACEELGVNHQLVKPVKMADLFNLLSQIHLKPAKVNEPAAEHRALDFNRSMTILVADDNPVNLILARTIIKRTISNALVIEVSNGLEAVRFCGKNIPDLILMDIQMPGLNGYEATQQIRQLKHPSYIPIIALTAGTVKEEWERCMAAGMDDLVIKPVVEDTVAAVLKKWLTLSTVSEPL